MNRVETTNAVLQVEESYGTLNVSRQNTGEPPDCKAVKRVFIQYVCDVNCRVIKEVLDSVETAYASGVRRTENGCQDVCDANVRAGIDYLIVECGGRVAGQKQGCLDLFQCGNT